MAKAVTKTQQRVTNPKTGKTKLVTVKRTVKTNVGKDSNLTNKQLQIQANKQIALAKTAQVGSIALEAGRTIRSFAPQPAITSVESNKQLIEGGLQDTSNTRDEDEQNSAYPGR